jgi:hypothetical protein
LFGEGYFVDKEGRTALVRAAREGHEAVVQLLLSISDVLFLPTKISLSLRENDKHCTRRSKLDTDS